MAHERAAIDITDTPEVLRLAKEVFATGESRVLQHAGEVIAVLMPPRAQRATTRPIALRHASRLHHDLRVVEQTAGALKQYARQPAATIAQKKEAFAQDVADEVMESLKR